MVRLNHIPNKDLWELTDEREVPKLTRFGRDFVQTEWLDEPPRRTSQRESADDSQQVVVFEDRPLNDALFDEQCAGRPRKLTNEEQEHLAVEF